VVVAIDRSPRAVDALRWAAEEARRRHLQLHVVGNRQDLAHVPIRHRAVDRSPGDVRARARATLDDIVREALDDRGTLSLRVVISNAPLGVAVSAAGRGAQLIVVPCGRHRWRRSRLLRSVLRSLDRVECPVVAIAAPVPIVPAARLRLVHGGRRHSSPASASGGDAR
jgi:nucleotide-binding universal stress UspA family protein